MPVILVKCIHELLKVMIKLAKNLWPTCRSPNPITACKLPACLASERRVALSCQNKEQSGKWGTAVYKRHHLRVSRLCTLLVLVVCITDLQIHFGNTYTVCVCRGKMNTRDMYTVWMMQSQTCCHVHLLSRFKKKVLSVAPWCPKERLGN